MPEHGQELYVSLSDMETLCEQLLERGYKFTGPDDPSSNTVTVTFDDGYYNNTLFQELGGGSRASFRALRLC